MQTPPAVELNGVRVTHSDGALSKTVLDGVDLCVPVGALVLLKGPSGSGKSTLLRLLCGLQSAQAGRIALFGRPLQHYFADHPRRDISYLPQVPVVLPRSVRHNLLLGYTFEANRDLTPPTQDQLRTQLAEVGLADVALDRRADRLSVGQQQRLCLVRNLLAEPRLILLDEPTASLDAESARLVWGCVARVHQKRTGTVILVSHQDVPRDLIPDQTLALDSHAKGRHAG